MAIAIDWISRSWDYILLVLGFLGALTYALRMAYAAERDRQALKNSENERERLALEANKLKLEITKLRNDPELLAKRRPLYDQLRGEIQGLIAEADASREVLSRLRELRHECDLAFPYEENYSLFDKVIRADTDLYTSNKIMSHRGVADRRYEEATEKQEAALLTLLDSQKELLALFKPYISLS